MWKALRNIVSTSLKPECLLHQQLRTTFILKRRNPPLAHKQGSHPKRLRNKHYIYDLVKDTNMEKQPNITVILTQYVEGVGQKGERISMPPLPAYNKLLVPGYAVYASPEMLDKYKDFENHQTDQEHSSPTSARTINLLSNHTLSVTMNKETPWTLKPWHIRNCFRRSGFHVPDEAITLPNKPIKGPNMELQGKVFYVTITINNLETVKVRCLLHHWATDVSERIPHEHDFFKREFEPIFPEDAEIIATLPSTMRLKSLSENTM